MLFSRQSEVGKGKFEQNLKIWKSVQDGGRLWRHLFDYMLPWKPVRHHLVSLNWNYKWSLLYIPNFKSIGWIVSKLEGGEDPIDSPPPLKASCNYFFQKASRVKTIQQLFYEHALDMSF